MAPRVATRPATAGTVDLTDPTAPDDRALVVGLIATAIAALLIMVVLGEVIPPVVMFVLIFLGLAAGISRSPKRWLRWAAAAAPLLLVAANAPFAAVDLSHPESFRGFAPTLLVIGSALVTAVVALWAARGRSVPTARVWTIAAVVLGAGVAFSAVSAATLADDAVEAGDVAIAAVGFTFPDRVEVPAGSAGLAITNADGFHHTFVIDALDVKVELPGSSVRRLDVTIPAGEYGYYCDLPGHDAMVGTLVAS